MIKKVLSDSTEVMAYPISIPQQFMYYMSALYGAKFPVNNIGMAYYIHGDIDTVLMKKALSEAIMRCDTMRLRFIRDEKYRILQYVTKESELEIEQADMSDIPLEEAKKRMLSISRAEIPVYECEIHKIMLIKLEKGINCIFLRFHHFAMDAYSVKVFLNDVLEIYLHKTTASPYPLPMKEYIPVLLQELSYINSEEEKADKEYWYRSLKDFDEPIFTDYMLKNRLKEQRKTHPGHRFADIHSGSPDADTLIFSLTEEESNSILDCCNKNGFSVCAFLSMGLRTALSVFNDNEEDVSFKMIINRRGSIAQKKSGGIRINYFPMRSIIKPDASFADAVNNISDVQNDIYPHCSLSFAQILEERHKSMPEDAKPDSTYDSIGFSYQPLVKGAEIPNTFCESEWFNNGASMIPLYLTVKHRTSDGGFDFIFEYRKEPNPEKDLQVFFKKIKGALLSGAKNPSVLTGELLEHLQITEEERNIYND